MDTRFGVTDHTIYLETAPSLCSSYLQTHFLLRAPLKADAPTIPAPSHAASLVLPWGKPRPHTGSARGLCPASLGTQAPQMWHGSDHADPSVPPPLLLPHCLSAAPNPHGGQSQPTRCPTDVRGLPVTTIHVLPCASSPPLTLVGEGRSGRAHTAGAQSSSYALDTPMSPAPDPPAGCLRLPRGPLEALSLSFPPGVTISLPPISCCPFWNMVRTVCAAPLVASVRVPASGRCVRLSLPRRSAVMAAPLVLPVHLWTGVWVMSGSGPSQGELQ